jgi:hypothetical protein
MYFHQIWYSGCLGYAGRPAAPPPPTLTYVLVDEPPEHASITVIHPHLNFPRIRKLSFGLHCYRHIELSAIVPLKSIIFHALWP